MKTKKINVEFEEVKVVEILLDLGSLENYMSKFLALKNHERETDEILEVRGIRDSNSVHVTLLIEENNDEAKEVERCEEFLEQFGTVERCNVETAWILSDEWNSISSKLDYAEWYLYR